MLSEQEVLRRAIRWSVLAELKSHPATRSRANAYIETLAISDDDQDGKKPHCAKNLRRYAKQLAESFKATGANEGDINEWLSEQLGEGKGDVYMTYWTLLDAPKNPQIRLSDWIVIDGYCATRIIEGGDPENVADRVAFIEKSPRVRTAAYTVYEEEQGKWFYGPKGAGGCLEMEGETIYGFYPRSRQWCDAQLVKAGYFVPNPTATEFSEEN